MIRDSLVWHLKSFDDLSRDELYQIIAARLDVFVVEQNCSYLDTDQYDQKALHLWAEHEGEVVAYCRLFDKGIKYEEASIGRVLSRGKGRGQNVGRHLVGYAVQIIENVYGTSSIRISAQDYLLNFYAEFGFIKTDKKYLEDNLPHTEMYRL